MRGQRGFTLIEVLVMIAVGGMIIPVVVAAIFNVVHGTIGLRNDFVIQQDIDTASSWFNRDLSLAQTTDVVDGQPPVNQMRVDWIDMTGWAEQGGGGHFAEYYIEPGTTLLKRNYDGTVSIVARYVGDIEFSRSGRFITIAITSTYREQTEALVYFVTPRADGALQ